jgi:hypothetical protein
LGATRAPVAGDPPFGTQPQCPVGDEVSRPQPNGIVNGRSVSCVAEKELDLLQFAARQMAQGAHVRRRSCGARVETSALTLAALTSSLDLNIDLDAKWTPKRRGGRFGLHADSRIYE